MAASDEVPVGIPGFPAQRTITYSRVVDLSHLFAAVQIGVATLQGKSLPKSALKFIEALVTLSSQRAPAIASRFTPTGIAAYRQDG